MEPWPWDEVMRETYKERNRIERVVLQGEAVPAVRDPLREARRTVYLGLVRLVFGFIHVKKTALSVNTP